MRRHPALTAAVNLTTSLTVVLWSLMGPIGALDTVPMSVVAARLVVGAPGHDQGWRAPEVSHDPPTRWRAPAVASAARGHGCHPWWVLVPPPTGAATCR